MFVFDMSVRSVIKRAETILNVGKVNGALRLVHNFVERIVAEQICTAQVFSSFELDHLCLRIGRRSLNSLAVRQEQHLSGCESVSTVVYVVSRLQRSGGHSRLVQDFIRAQPEKKHLILSTEVGGCSDIEFFSKLFGTKDNVCFVRAPGGNFEVRLKWLQSTLLPSQPEHVYLFNHHQDSVAVSALVPELELEGSFCHHGDHHLCLGVHFSHLSHIDFHPMGFHHCRDELGIDNKYLPLTFEDKQSVPVETDFMQGGNLITATAARWNKIEVPYYISYLDIIPRVLKATGGQHVHIGRLTPWALFRIYRQMRKQGVQSDRFIYIEWTPSVWKALQEHKVDIYLASFPYGAGLTLIEAMGAGIPVIMHEHMYSRVLSGLELAYKDAFSWYDPEKLLRHLDILTPDCLLHEKELSRQHYEYFHQPKILRAYLYKPESVQSNIPKLSKEFKPRYDEWANYITNRLNISYIISRDAYRFFIRMRSLFH